MYNLGTKKLSFKRKPLKKSAESGKNLQWIFNYNNDTDKI